MNFKEMLDKDLEIMFNPEEIGVTVDFSGTILTAIKSKESFKRKYAEKKIDAKIYSDGITISVKKTDLILVPELNDKVRIDQKEYLILDIEDLGNTYRFSMTEYRR